MENKTRVDKAYNKFEFDMQTIVFRLNSSIDNELHPYYQRLDLSLIRKDINDVVEKFMEQIIWIASTGDNG